jgi:DNA-directed RNA polymerase III subunit RPC1
MLQVVCPVLMARVLTYSERVSYYNIEKSRQCIRNGPCKHPRTNFIIHKVVSCKLMSFSVFNFPGLHMLFSSSVFKYCDRRIAAQDLKYGCVVENHLEDGDIVLFNRHPSLHRM